MSGTGFNQNKKYVVTVICDQDECETLIYNMFEGRLLRIANGVASKATRGLVSYVLSRGNCLYGNNYCNALLTTQELKSKIRPPENGYNSNTYNRIINTFPDLIE
jgi:hypothetical protein